MESNVDGGEAIVEAFRNLDIDYVICSPGSEWPSDGSNDVIGRIVAQKLTEVLGG